MKLASPEKKDLEEGEMHLKAWAGLGAKATGLIFTKLNEAEPEHLAKTSPHPYEHTKANSQNWTGSEYFNT